MHKFSNNCFTNELDTYKSALKVAKTVHNKQQKQQADQERLERANISSDKSVGPGGGGLLRRYTMPLNELVEIPGDLVRKSKMTSNGLLSIPYEKNRPRALLHCAMATRMAAKSSTGVLCARASGGGMA